MIDTSQVHTTELLRQQECCVSGNGRIKITQNGAILLVKIEAALVVGEVLVGLESHHVRLQLVTSRWQPLGARRVAVEARVRGATSRHLYGGIGATRLFPSMPDNPIVALVARFTRVTPRKQILIDLAHRSALTRLTARFTTEVHAVRCTD